MAGFPTGYADNLQTAGRGQASATSNRRAMTVLAFIEFSIGTSALVAWYNPNYEGKTFSRAVGIWGAVACMITGAFAFLTSLWFLKEIVRLGAVISFITWISEIAASSIEVTSGTNCTLTDCTWYETIHNILVVLPFLGFITTFTHAATGVVWVCSDGSRYHGIVETRSQNPPEHTTDGPFNAIRFLHPRPPAYSYPPPYQEM